MSSMTDMASPAKKARCDGALRTSLKLTWSKDVESVREILRGCPGIKELEIEDLSTSTLTSLAPIEAQLRDLAGSLTHLTLCNCVCLEDISVLEILPGLTHLDFAGNPSVEDFSVLESLKKLAFLDVSDTLVDGHDVRLIARMTSLTNLNITTEDLLDEHVSVLQSLTGLTSLHVGYITHLRWLPALTNLIKLEVDPCSKLECLTPLQELPALKELSVEVSTDTASRLRVVGGLTGLCKLSLSWSEYYEGDKTVNNPVDLSLLTGLTNLTHLDIFGGEAEIDTTPLAGMKNLTVNHTGLCGMSDSILREALRSFKERR